MVMIRASQIRSYFCSGWAFFLPYLAAYTVYALNQWPVVRGETGGLALPTLFEVYRALHVIHLLLVGVTLWSLSTKPAESPGDKNPHSESGNGVDRDNGASPSLVPWICLGLVFCLPGLYLEWPSDPWEHLRRINEWAGITVVGDHSTWQKSSYLLAYSLTAEQGSNAASLAGLRFYVAGMCLLLCWQFFLLSRAVGLSSRSSMLFVILGALAFGNSSFSFYRYYGLSSTILAQIAVVALVRHIVAELRSRQTDKISTIAPPSLASIWSRGPAILLLLALIAMNHLQGVGIAALAVFSGICWFLSLRVPRLTLALAATLVVAGTFSLLALPRHPDVDSIYHSRGLVTQWYGLFSLNPESPVFRMGIQVMGPLGVVNFLAGLVLMYRRHLVGFLTCIPSLVMSCPLFTLPILNFLAARGHVDELSAIHRFHFAEPIGMALLILTGMAWRRFKPLWESTRQPGKGVSLFRTRGRLQFDPVLYHRICRGFSFRRIEPIIYLPWLRRS